MPSDASTKRRDVLDQLHLQAVNRDVLAELSELLAYEAWLLDNGHFEHWQSLLADDLRYVAPARRKLPDEAIELAALDRLDTRVCHFNDGKMEVGFRIARFRTGFDHYNRPQALVRRLIGNLRLLAYTKGAAEASLTSNFMVMRAREEKEETVFAGARDDIWRRCEDGGWLLARRLIKLDHHIVPPLSVLF